MRSEETAILRASPEAVWEVLADWRRYPRWMPDVAWVRPLQAGAQAGAGFRLLVRTKVFGLPAASDVVEITRWEPPHRMGVRHEGVVKGPAEWRLEGTGPWTRWVWWEDLTMGPGALGELALRMYWPWQRRMFRRSMDNVRRLVEEA